MPPERGGGREFRALLRLSVVINNLALKLPRRKAGSWVCTLRIQSKAGTAHSRKSAFQGPENPLGGLVDKDNDLCNFIDMNKQQIQQGGFSFSRRPAFFLAGYYVSRLRTAGTRLI